MDTKIALDMEIAVYRRLLESEETRLGLLVDGEGNIIRPLANFSNTKCLTWCLPDGLVTRITPPTPVTSRAGQEVPGHSWGDNKHFTEL